MTTPRLAPLSDHDWPAEIGDMLAGFAGGLNVYRTMAHHPALLRAWGPLREHVVNRSALGRQYCEVVILRTGLRLGSSYEWRQHVVRARKLGMSDARIASLLGRPRDMAKDDATLARAVDETFETHRLSDASITALTALVGQDGMLDLLATVGFYSTLGLILNSFETPLDDNIATELDAAPLAGGPN